MYIYIHTHTTHTYIYLYIYIYIFHLRLLKITGNVTVYQHSVITRTVKTDKGRIFIDSPFHSISALDEQ